MGGGTHMNDICISFMDQVTRGCFELVFDVAERDVKESGTTSTCGAGRCSWRGYSLIKI